MTLAEAALKNAKEQLKVETKNHKAALKSLEEVQFVESQHFFIGKITVQYL